MSRITEMELEKRVLSALDPLQRSLGVSIVAREPLIYSGGPASRDSRRFRVDILIHEPMKERVGGEPLVAIELKANGASTHDLLTYSAKARLHRSVLTHLRYGLFVAGDSSHGITPKWLWHGDAFDFMISCYGSEPTEPELGKLQQIVQAEVQTARQLKAFLVGSERPRPSVLWRGELS